MPISIDNSDIELLAHKLADLTDETLTDAVGKAIAERYERLRPAPGRGSLGSDLTETAVRCASRPIISDLTGDEILGYNESGVPTR